MPRNVIVTGGAGYIGSYCSKLLARSGFTPIVVDDLSLGHREAVQWGPLEEINLLETQKLIELFERERPEGVFHFAALSKVAESVQYPERYERNNVEGTQSLLKAMEESGVKKLIFSSTCATIGIPTSVPIDESHPCSPVNPYGLSKLKVEGLLRENTWGLKAVALRYFNAAGADPEGEVGEVHDPETHLIPIALEVARGEREKLEIYGEDYPTPDGTCIRDYIHIHDLATAHLKGFERLSTQSSPLELFHLGTGKGYSVKEVVQVVEQVTGKKIATRVSPRRPGDPPELVADPSRAMGEGLGWKVKYPNLLESVQHAYQWSKEKKYG